MDEARIERALNRIEAAFSRIKKRAAATATGAQPAGPGDEALRQQVESAVAQLDELIAGLER